MGSSRAAGSARSRQSAHPDLLVLFLESPPELSAYQELRQGFTAAVSHELRTPLARLLVLLESATLPGADIDELTEPGSSGGRAGSRADRRRPLPRRARDGPRGRLPRSHAGQDDRGGGRRLVQGARQSRRGRARGPGRRPRRPAPAAADAPGRGREPARERASLCRPGKHLHRRADESRRGADAHGLGRRQGRRPRRPAAPVRALLPGRPGAHEPRHGARSRDREAHRHVGGRRGGGSERARARASRSAPASRASSRSGR